MQHASTSHNRPAIAHQVQPRPFHQAVRYDAPQVPARHKRTLSRPASHSYVIPSANVSAAELQSALLLVLALYASTGLLNLATEFAALMEHWRTFVDFLAIGLFSR
jgi:hypothetical protein